MTFMCTKSGLRDVCLFHPDLMVARAKVKFNEKHGSIKFIKEVINNWIGNLSLMVNLLRSWKLRHMHQVPSFSNTMTASDECD
jgi:hypothetical protein